MRGRIRRDKLARTWLVQLLILFACLIITPRALAQQIIWENEGASNTSYPSGSVASSGRIDMTTSWYTVTDGGTFASTGFADFVSINHGVTGNHAGLLLLSFQNSDDDPDDKIIMDFTFNRRVAGLSFSILDIDQDGGSDIEDFVEVEYHTGDNNWINLTTQTSFWSAGGSAFARDNESFGEGWEGNSSAANTSTDGNLNINFGNTVVKAVRIRYFSGDDEASPDTYQWVAISDLSFVDPLEVTLTTDTTTPGDLRFAVNHANTYSDEDDITFNVPGGGSQVVFIGSTLSITDDGVNLDGTTQPGASCGSPWSGSPPVPTLRIDGVGNATTGGNFDGFDIQADNVTIRGLSLTSMDRALDVFNAASGFEASCNVFGIRETGVVDWVRYSAVVGGQNSTFDGNRMSSAINDALWFQSNASGAVVTGNIIGDHTSTAEAYGNAGSAIRVDQTSNVTIGGTASTDRNIISDNSGDGITVQSSASNVTILNNWIGVASDGTSALPNGANGITVNGSSSVTIGNGTSTGRNVISSNPTGIFALGTTSNLFIRDNYLNTTSSGNASLAGSSQDTIVVNGSSSNVEITDNVLGPASQDRIEFWGSASASNVTIQGNRIGVGADGSTVLSGALVGVRIWAGYTVTGLLLGGSDPADANVISNNGEWGVYIDGASSGLIQGNTIEANTRDGVSLFNGATLAITENVFSGNGELAIDLSGGTEDGNAVTANDTGDGDSGPNNLLNHPVINTVSSSGTTLNYDLTLDAPADTNGYRIEFFSNSSADASGYGEGETYLGFFDTGNHAVGSVDYSGSLTASTSVPVGTIVSATATRKTASSFDITSEFSANDTTISPLIVANTNDSGTGSLRSAITFANANAGEDDITFSIEGAGPHRITLASDLPDLSDTGVMIDGLSQSGASCGQLTTGTVHDLRIIIDGNAGSTVNPVQLSGDQNVVRGVSVVNTGNRGVFIANGSTNAIAECLYVGIEPDGTTANSINRVSGGGGVDIQGADGATLRNSLISANNALSGTDAVRVDSSSSNTTITGNIIGLNAAGSSALPNGDVGIVVDSGTSNTIIGGTTATERNIISGNGQDGIRIRQTAAGVTITGNYIGLSRDGSTQIGNQSSGVEIVNSASGIQVGDGTSAGANRIVGNSDRGVQVSSTAQAAILLNEIHSNGSLAIDLVGGTEDGNSVTANDTGDVDTGPNDLLNYPVINSVTADGTTLGYDVTLDAPSDTNGYRIEFYANSSADASGYGEGETYLGSFDTGNHTGGSVNYTGSFTATQSVSVGTIVTATATRKTASSFDITSEFAANILTTSAISPLIVTNTNDSGTGSLRAAITYANANASEDAITFDISGSGVKTITLLSALPSISDEGVSIDGTTQTGASCGQLSTGTPHTLTVEIDGNAGSHQLFTIAANNVSIKGVAVGNSQAKGIFSASGNSGVELDCSYWGVRADGVTAWPLATSGITGPSQITGGSGHVITNSLFSGNNTGADRGFILQDVTGAAVTGSLFGLRADGTAVLPNGNEGILLAGTNSDVVIGGTTAETRNIISGNVGNGVTLSGSDTDISIIGNYIGVAVDGATVLANGGSGIEVPGATSVTIGDGTVAGRNVIAGQSGSQIYVHTGGSIDLNNNLIGLGAGGETLGGGYGVRIWSTTSSLIQNNQIAHQTQDGIFIESVSTTHGVAAIIANAIFSNTGLGIALDDEGVTANDTSDVDTGPNDLLNFPVINAIYPSGTTVNYDVTLDVPTHTDGYRIDFFKNSSADPTGYGEGETPLGFVNVSGSGNYTGSFTASETVLQGDVITATTTRRTATGWDITSEFSLAYTAEASTELTASKSVSVFDPFGQGLYALPGNDIISSLTVTNPGFAAADTDTIVIIDAVPPELTFYNGDMDDGGPATDAVYFTQANGAGLSWTYSTDAKFSNSVSRPTDMSGCTYTPSAGYDSNVTYVCFNPKGAMAAGDPDPSFTVQFRARIK